MARLTPLQRAGMKYSAELENLRDVEVSRYGKVTASGSDVVCPDTLRWIVLGGAVITGTLAGYGPAELRAPLIGIFAEEDVDYVLGQGQYLSGVNVNIVDLLGYAADYARRDAARSTKRSGVSRHG